MNKTGTPRNLAMGRTPYAIQRRKRNMPDKTSKFLGVSRDKNGKWRARLAGKQIGTFARETDAAKAYDHEAIQAYGPLAQTNFPSAE